MKILKMFTLSVMLLLGFTLQARAHTSTNFDYTGNDAQNIDDLWISNNPPNVINNYIGGPAGDDVAGYAQQFTLSVPTNITSLVATISNDPGEFNSNDSGTTIFTYDLYSGTTFYSNPSDHIPLVSSLVTQSAPISFTQVQPNPDSVPTPKTTTEELAFNANLQPGTYWIAEQGSGGGFTATSQTYNSGNTAQTPEPTVWVFFVMMFGFIILKGRENVLGRLV